MLTFPRKPIITMPMYFSGILIPYRNVRVADSRQIDYRISIQNRNYTLKEISLSHHYFSYLTDGIYDTLIFHSDDQISLARENETIQKTGSAITFFLTIPSEAPNLKDIIRNKLDEFRFAGEDQYLITIIPHLFFDAGDEAIIRVVVFE